MTKKEHDAATKQNYGGPMGHRQEYRRGQHREYRDAGGQVASVDKLAQRAWEMARRNTRYNVLVEGYYLPTLGRGSRFRTFADYRKAKGIPLLP